MFLKIKNLKLKYVTIIKIIANVYLKLLKLIVLNILSVKVLSKKKKSLVG